MSSPQPRPSARRRIAGERRPRAEPTPAERFVASRAPTPPPATEPEPAPLPPSPPSPTPAAAVGAPEKTGQRRPRGARPGPGWLVISVLGALALLLVVAAAVLGLGVWNVGKVREQSQVDEATREAPAAAERAAATILSYSYRSLGADEKAAERYMTPSYAAKYAKTFDKLVRPHAPKIRAKVVAEVKASGVSHADPHRVNVLVYVNQTTTSTANGGEPQQALNRVMLSMRDQGGTWKVDNITSY